MSFNSYSVIKDNLSNSFSGLIGITQEGVMDASCNVVDNLVTVIPCTEEARKAVHKYSYNIGEEANHNRWFYGLSDLNSAIAVLQLSPMQVRFSSGIDMCAGYFHTPIIVLGSDASVTNIKSFDSIEFYGGVMDALYNPGYGIKYGIKYGKRQITFENPKDYAHEYEVTINGEKIKISYFIRSSFVESIEIPDLKENLRSVLRFDFVEKKSLDDIVKYYSYAMRLFQFCAGCLNLRTEICLFNQENPNAPMYVRMKDVYLDYANDRIRVKRVIGLLDLGDKLPELISLLTDEKRKPYLEFLPSINKYAETLLYTQVTDLCVSFENEYKGLAKDTDEKMREEAANLSDQLIEYIKNADIRPIIRSKAISIIEGNLRNFSPSLKEKMMFFFNQYKDEMRTITEQKPTNAEYSVGGPLSQILNKLDHESLGIAKFYSDEEFEKKIKSFISIRGSAAHAGIRWNGGEEIYMHLVLLIYFSILDRAGYGDADRARIWL